MHDKSNVNFPQLLNAVRSQLHFSQISAWLSTHENAAKISKGNLTYRLSLPGETFEVSQFTSSAIKHDFPVTDIGNGLAVQISLLSLPRLPEIPSVKCNKCEPVLNIPFEKIEISSKKLQKNLVDDRMYTSCTLKGKHRCEDFDELECGAKKEFSKFKRVCQSSYLDPMNCKPSTSKYVEKPKLCVDLKKASLYHVDNIASNSCSTELNCNDKRNLSPNVEQKIKNPKLDLDLSRIEIQQETNNGASSKLDVEKDIENDLIVKPQSKGDILLNAILRSCQLKSKNDSAQINNSQRSTNSSILSKNKQATDIQNKLESERDDDKKVRCDFKCVQKFGLDRPSMKCANALIKSESDNNNSSCDNLSESGDISSIKDKAKYNIYLDKHCDSPIPKIKYKKIRDISNVQHNLHKYKARQKITFQSEDEDDDEDDNDEDDDEHKSNIKSLQLEDEELLNFANFEDKTVDLTQKGRESNNAGIDIPSASEQAKFRKSLDNATSMVFHSRTGLPLTSSPAPVRRGKSCFDFDSSINSVSAIGK